MKTTRELIADGKSIIVAANAVGKTQLGTLRGKLVDLWASQQDDRDLVKSVLNKMVKNTYRPVFMFCCLLLMFVKVAGYLAYYAIRATLRITLGLASICLLLFKNWFSEKVKRAREENAKGKKQGPAHK